MEHYYHLLPNLRYIERGERLVVMTIISEEKFLKSGNWIILPPSTHVVASVINFLLFLENYFYYKQRRGQSEICLLHYVNISLRD